MRISVTTPLGSVLDTEAEEVTAPGELGEFGILPGHIPFISALKPGVLVCKSRGGTQALAVGNGILEISQGTAGERVVALVDQALGAPEVDQEQAAREASDLDKEITRWKGDSAAELAMLTARRAWAQARLDVASRAK